MATSCTIIGVVASGAVQYNTEKPSYDFLLQFWNHHRNCTCMYCKSTVTVQQPNIHVKDNPKLLISDYPSLIASDKSKEISGRKGKTRPILTCNQCQKEFRFKKWYARHTATCTGVTTCETCGKTFTSKRCIQDHMRNVHGSTIYTCTSCYKAFKTKAGVEKHTRRLHTPTEQQYACPEDQCDKTFGCKQSLGRHMRNHREDATQFYCDYCGIFFQNAYNLKRHRLMQHVRKTIRCTQCDMLFDTLNEWWQHMESHEKRRYRCPECPLTFDKNKNLRRHSLVHTTQKSFHCGLCDKSFKLKKSLLFHQTHRHLRSRTFPCLRCGKKFSRKYILTTHMKIHSPKTFHCQLDNCNESFHTQYRLACHVAARHHSYFVQTRRLRAASCRERNRMISQYYNMQNDFSYSSFTSSFTYLNG